MKVLTQRRFVCVYLCAGGIQVEVFPSSDPSSAPSATKFFVVVATPFRHYQFIGGPTFEAMFVQYQQPAFVEFPGAPLSLSLSLEEVEKEGGKKGAYTLTFLFITITVEMERTCSSPFLSSPRSLSLGGILRTHSVF